MLPEIAQLQINRTDSDDLPYVGKSFLFDFENGDFILRDGRLVEVSGIEALKVWIEKILRTEKYRYEIYEREDKKEYGVVLEDLIVGNNFSYSFIEAELKREITEALTKNPLILSLSNWNIQKENPLVKISFKVNLKDESSFIQEVNL
ncbi:MAG: DUF2634 domain-containing protein [Clostridia bacterium]|nr:DUF2634 domain-containing protein [Clostridia bacterium]